MRKQLGFVLALILCGVLSVGVAPKASAVGMVYNINAVTGWPTIGNITLNDGDTLNIAPDAGSPTSATVIIIAANANVTINGGGVMRTNVRIYESPSDTVPHSVTINDLQVTAPTGTRVYIEYLGTINLVGTNVFVGATNYIALQASASGSVSSITSSTGGTLTVSSANTTSYDLLKANTLNIQGTAHVTASSTIGKAVHAVDAVNIDVGASLTAIATNDAAIGGTSLVVTNNGLLTISGGTTIYPALCGASGSPTVKMGGGAVTSITSALIEDHSFIMIPASGFQWQLSGGASLVSPSTVMSSPASISVAGGSTGVVKLVPIAPTTVAMYRIMNPSTGEHFYTSSAKEVQVNVASGAWKYEGIGWVAPLSGTPVYRLAAIPGTGSAGHLFTTSTKERDAALASVNPAGQSYWRCETGVGMPVCVGWFSGGSVPVFRAYYPGSGQHNYTTDTNEQRVITTQQGWKDEGVGWFGVARGDPGAPMPV